MRFRELKSSENFDPLKDAYCAHCLVPFNDEDDVGKCEQTDHKTHVECTKHNP